MIRYVIRPAGIRSTPSLIRDALGARRTVRYPGTRRSLSWSKDFFLSYPEPYYIEEFQNAQNDTRGYAGFVSARAFFTSNKPMQRSTLASLGFPVPRTYRGRSDVPDIEGSTDTFVARPLRHRSGHGFRILPAGSSWDPTTEYLQELYPKTHEYRILIVRGTPLITLLKRVPDGTPSDQPWNHAHGAHFVTVNNPENNRLRHTDVYEVVNNSRHFLSYIDLAGLDVMFNQNDQSYRVCELNLCPSLSIPDNLQKVREHVLSFPRQS